jgi:HAD superfamily hydrolase (TIGR01509 family)
MSGLQGVCCDLDGTLIDSEPYWFAAEFELVGQWGGQWSDAQSQALIGSHLPQTGATLQAAGVGMEVDAIIAWLLDAVEAKVKAARPFLPGAVELLRAARAEGLGLALVTMSYQRTADMIEAMEPGLFDVVVTGDNVAHGKPHPEPYRLACQRLGLAPGGCVALEDSPTGIASAMAAGLPTVAIPLNAPVPAAPGLSRVGSVAELTLDVLRRVVQGELVDTLA